MTKPITPEQARKKRESGIPDSVIEIFNKLIVSHLNQSGEAKIKQNEIVEEISKTHGKSRDTIFALGWLDVEPIFRKAGWKVIYDKPAYYETYEPSFTFSRK